MYTVMKQTLQNLFKPYRPLPTVTAHRNVRMRGQAFISFADHESANRARKDVHEFPLYGKPMVCFSKLDMIPADTEGKKGGVRPSERMLLGIEKTRAEAL